MRINTVLNSNVTTKTTIPKEPAKTGESFGDTLTKAIEKVNDLQKQADSAAVKVATGDVENIHQAMIAMEKAVLALEFTVQVRNKAVEAYQELMRTQI